VYQYKISPNKVENETTRKSLYTKLKRNTLTDDAYLTRLMRKYWKRGHTSVKNQIILDANSYTWFERNGHGWIKVQSFERGKRIAIPLASTHPVAGTIRLILRNGNVKVHHVIALTDDTPCGEATLGIDKGYTEAFTDSDGERHGLGLGKEISTNSNDLKPIYQARSKLMTIAEKYADAHPEKAKRIHDNNLRRKKLNTKKKRHNAKIRTIAFTAAHSVVDKAKVIAVEDLTKPIKRKDRKKTSRKNYGKNQRRRLNSWAKGVLVEALSSVSLRRGASVVPVNCAYTSQILQGGRRCRLECSGERAGKTQ